MDTQSFQILLGLSCLLIGMLVGWIARGPSSRRAANRAVDSAYRRIEERARRQHLGI